MSVSISLTSTSFDNNAVIPQQFKNNIICGGNNRSPEFSWTLYGIVQAHVEHFNLYVENTNLPGSSPHGKFLHWAVTEITKTQQQIVENGWWLDPNTNVLSTDYISGDKINGWNGPCADQQYLYRAWIEAKIAPQYAAFIWGEDIPVDLILRSNYYLFLDRATNVIDNPTIADCNSEICPPGYELIGNQCQEIITQAATLNNVIYTPVVRTSPAWGEFGTKFIRNTDQYSFPIKGTANVTYGFTDNAGIAVSSDLIGPVWVANKHLGPIISTSHHNLWYPSDSLTSRFNNTGVWTNANNHPIKEWIGFTYCLTILETRTYCIGLAGDNTMRFKVNGELIVYWPSPELEPQDTYRVWYIFEIKLKAGINIIEVEGYNQRFDAGLGFEIYEATVDELEVLANPTELSLSDYVIFDSRNPAIEEFNIGENSGYNCPDGFALSCDEVVCTQIHKSDAEIVNCCWIIENCLNPQEQYRIQISINYTEPIFLDGVYQFTNNQIFIDSQTGFPKCFKIIGKAVCDQGTTDAVDVEVIQYYGSLACNACLTPHKFQRCDNAVIERIVTLQQNQPDLIVGNIYQLNIDPGNCYIYLGESTETITDTGITIILDYQTDDCDVCNGCLRIRNCNSNEDRIIRLAVGADNPNLDQVGNIMTFVGHPDIDYRCWKFIGYEDCIDPDYINILLDTVYDCKECGVCLQYYKLTDCANPENILYIYWQEAGEFQYEEFPNEEISEIQTSRLESHASYVFDFDESTCFTAERQYGLCEPMTAPVLNISNLIYEVDDCEECGALCYKLVDCETQEEYRPEPQTGLGIYLGRTVRWTTEEDPNTIRCASVQSYRCLDGADLPITTWILQEGCYVDCESCVAQEETVEPNFYIRKRVIKPGSTIPPCTDSTNTNCY